MDWAAWMEPDTIAVLASGAGAVAAMLKGASDVEEAMTGEVTVVPARIGGEVHAWLPEQGRALCGRSGPAMTTSGCEVECSACAGMQGEL